MKEKVILVFDIGKTNKKVLLFDKDLNVIYQEEEKFNEIIDDDGFACDDIELLEKWFFESLQNILGNENYEVLGINFSTYGATLMYLDENNKRLTPVYNYLKPMPDGIVDNIYQNYGGVDEFSRKTASPALGMLNSGFQALWLKNEKKEIYEKVKNIVHFPQYLSLLLTGKVVSELTSIGCHTAMWDFDQNKYHQWVSDESISLPEAIPNDTVFETEILGKKVKAGIGIHDSSSSLAPYILGSKEKFILLSTGTWCIAMNPYNPEPLTAEELAKDCLCYMGVNQQQVKSSRLFMGQFHESNTKYIASYFKVPEDSFKSVKVDEKLVESCMKNKVFFKGGVPEDYIDKEVDLGQFTDFNEAYHQFIVDLTNLGIESLKLVVPVNDETKYIYISGGFARNEIYVRMIASVFPDKKVFTSEIDNATALGAALVIYSNSGMGELPPMDLGLKEWKPFM